MSFIADIFVFIISGYLVFTNALAGFIIGNPEPIANNEKFTPSIVREIKSQFTEEIPDILLQNSQFQSATVLEGTLKPQTFSAPVDALVNIYCRFQTENNIRTTTGSGYFINENGVILTNAHIAQFLLFDEVIDGDVSCVIRTGTPAVATYELDLLYISPAWVRENADLYNQEIPKGTGERDYALVYVTDTTNNNPLPARFPALAIDTNLLTNKVVSEPVRAAGYPAANLGESIETNLKGIEVGTSIAELMTFGSGFVDLFTIAGTQIGAQGSSGGPVVNSDGYAIGLISTRGDDELFGEGSLRAISLSYIDRTITEETGFSLIRNTGGNLPYRASIFQSTLGPFLQLVLRQNILD